MRAEVAYRLSKAGCTRSALAREYHVSRQTIAKWAFRFAMDGVAGLRDRSSRPRRSPRRLARTFRRQVERRRRWSSLRIARDLHLPIATVVREQRRFRLGPRRPLEPPRPAIRYEWPAAGDLLHLDIKKLGRIGGVGHRIHGDRTRRSRGLGWEAVHVAIDDCTRLAYAEVLADETQETTSRFLQRALRYFARRGIQISRLLTDHGSAYRSRCFAAVVAQHQLRYLRTRPYTPRTNGKATPSTRPRRACVAANDILAYHTT